MGLPLSGKGVLVTRPRERAGGLAARLEALGARVLPFPTLVIAEPADMRRLHALIDRLDAFDWLIFVSPSAAERGVSLIRARRVFPPGPPVAAVGAGTAGALRALGVAEVLMPQAGADSESLLALPPMQAVRGARIAIFRGEGGREQLAAGLRARGAQVEYAECYRRRRPEADAAPILDAWARGEVHAVTVTSTEGLRNLYAMLGEAGRDRLCATPVFAPHERIADAARALGVHNAQATAPGDEGLVAALCAWFAGSAP